MRHPYFVFHKLFTVTKVVCTQHDQTKPKINPLNAELNPICHLLTLLGAHHIFYVSGLRVKNARVSVLGINPT